MNFFKRLIAFTLLFLLTIFYSQAQTANRATGKISGRIVDAQTGDPIQYTTIRLFTQDQNKLVNGVIADSKGLFKLTNVPDGKYKVVFDFLGYQKIEKLNVVLNKNNRSVAFDDIKLASSQTTLQGVTITAKKQLIENKIDKMVYNTEKDVSSLTGVATDVLKKVPQIAVDIDGNVELQGNSNIRFLIDGKPSVLFGSNITDVLQSIPASQIQNIEIITSPGAKYDAEGTGGIINIILKKNKAIGFNGNLSLSTGTRLENGSLNLSMRHGNFGLHGFFSGNAQLLSTTLSNMDRKSEDATTTSRLLQNGSNDFTRDGYQSGIGMDWDLTPRDNISATVNYNYFENTSTGSANRQTLLHDDVGIQLSDINDQIFTSNKFHQYSYEWGLNYKRKFKKEGQDFEILFNSSDGNKYSYYDQTQNHLMPMTIYNGSYARNPGLQNETNLEVNYVQPLGKDVVLETGAKMTHDKINSTSDVYLLNTTTGDYEYSTTQSSLVHYNRNVYAGYLSISFKLFKALDIKTGLRDEYSEANADFLHTGLINLKPLNSVVPSIVFSRTFEDHQNIKLSYSRRIQRPDYRDMNPFIDASDPKNISTGNQNLRPEIGDKLELSYSTSFNNGSNINATLFYRGNKDDIQSYTQFYPTYKIGDSTYTNVAISTRENIGREDNYGVNLFASYPIKDKLELRTNISFFDRYIHTGLPSGGDIHGINYRANLNASYQVSSNMIVEAMGNFNSSRLNAQGKMPSFTYYNVAFRKQFLKKKASFALTANNFFDKYVNMKTNLTGTNFTIVNYRQMPFRSFGFNFTYKFGKMEFKNEHKTEDNQMNPSGIE
ncbi:MAG: TonB-dependent receptor [Bacteroidetes bacterium]|nr:TonB-dependent receptor [Bacteroidota bacterium]